ncbi:MAG: tyrosine-type recombinase/integrase [Syntrophomonadaceae bacterium]
MNSVEPIRDSVIVEDITGYLKQRNLRDFIMFLLGIYTGLRISDILKLRVRDVRNKDYISIREKKTRKEKKFEIHPILKRELAEYTRNKEPDEYLVKSREGVNRPIRRERAYQILQALAVIYNLESVGTHTLRKTFGYHFYQQYKDVATLQRIFNHSHPSLTLRYIGIEQEGINKAIKGFRIY